MIMLINCKSESDRKRRHIAKADDPDQVPPELAVSGAADLLSRDWPMLSQRDGLPLALILLSALAAAKMHDGWRHFGG